MDFLVGVDEAGRGPVIGPLFIAAAICSRNNEKKLNSICKKDSKQLSAKQREEILIELEKLCKFRYIELNAGELNKRMGKQSLNDIEAEGMAELIKPYKNADIMIDLPDRYGWVFAERMKRFGIGRFEAQHKADENYPIVAAASIFAKVNRDKRVEEIKAKIGVDFGSGYPSDPKTRKVLIDKKMLEVLDPYIRKKWKTLDTVKQRKLFEEEENST